MKIPVIKLSLNHPIVLYFVLLVALANLLYLSVAGKYEFAAIFVLIGFLTSFFSKNMTVILVVAMVATSVLQFGGAAGIEGMEGKDDEAKPVEEEATKPAEEEAAKPVEEEAAKPVEKEAVKPVEKEVVKPTKPVTNEETALEKLSTKQKDLVNKIEKMEPTLKQIETFVERLDRFAKY